MATNQLTTAWHNIRRSPFQALAAIFTLVITFLVITLVLVLTYSSGKVMRYFETQPQIIAFIKDTANADSVNTLKEKLVSDARVSKVDYVSKEQALEIYKDATSENPLLSELVNPSIFPASIEVSLSNLNFAQAVIDEIKINENIDSVGFTASLGGENTITDVVGRLRRISNYIRLGGGIFAGMLVASSFTILVIIISMRVTSRRGEMEILDLIGAKPSFIRSPVILESFIYCAIGVFSGWFIILSSVLYLSPSIIGYFGEIPILPKSTLDLMIMFGIVLVSELLIGFVLALIGSFLAVARARKRKK